MAYNSKYTGEEVENLLTQIDNKQDAISDLDEIRRGASKGATAVQPDDIPNEVELIAISGDMLTDEPTYTAVEAQAIIEAYNANKLIALNSAMTRNYGNGWFIPNIYLRSLPTYKQVYISGVLANFYIEHRFIYNTNTGSITAVYVDKKVDLSAVTTTYVDEAIANAITNTLNTPV